MLPNAPSQGNWLGIILAQTEHENSLGDKKGQTGYDKTIDKIAHKMSL